PRLFFFSSRRRHTRFSRDWSSDVCSSDLQPSESFLSRYMKAREKSRVTGPFPYESKFSADNLVASLVIDPLRGMGVLLETQMNEIGRAACRERVEGVGVEAGGARRMRVLR